MEIELGFSLCVAFRGAAHADRTDRLLIPSCTQTGLPVKSKALSLLCISQSKCQAVIPIVRNLVSQVMGFLPLHSFSQCVNRYGGNRKVQRITCMDQFLCMAFAQLAYRAMHMAQAFFVTRARRGMVYKRRYSRPVEKDSGLRCDQTIVLPEGIPPIPMQTLCAASAALTQMFNLQSDIS